MVNKANTTPDFSVNPQDWREAVRLSIHGQMTEFNTDRHGQRDTPEIENMKTLTFVELLMDMAGSLASLMGEGSTCGVLRRIIDDNEASWSAVDNILRDLEPTNNTNEGGR